MKTCEQCGRPFTNDRNPETPFCSMECYNEHYTFTCERCGKNFFETWDRTYCFDCRKALGIDEIRQQYKAMKDGKYKEAMKEGDVSTKYNAAEVCEQLRNAHKLKPKKDSLQPVREKIDMARKPKMRTVEQYLCDNCDKVIDKPENGFVVHGNIYVADPSCSGGLIGNNFPPLEEGEELTSPDQIKQTVLCKPCFLKAVGVKDVNIRVGDARSDAAALDIDDVISGYRREPSPYDAGARRGGQRTSRR